jgi:hypothetical protein
MLDPSIPLNAGRPEPEPFAKTLGQMVSIRGMRQDQRAQQMQMDAATAQAERDQRFSQALQTGDIYKDPQMALSLLGPERGASFINGVVSLQKFMQGQKDVSEKDFQAIILGVQSLPEADRPKGYAMARDTLVKTGAIGEQDVPAQYNPTWAQMQASKGKEPEKPVSVSPGASLVDPRTGKPVYSAPANPVNVAPGSTLVDPQTGQARFTAPKAPSPQLREWLDYKSQGGPLPFDQYQTMDANRKRAITNVGGAGTSEPPPKVDPTSGAILAQTGLSQNAFLAATGQMSSLGRDTKTRTAATREWQNYAVTHGIDTSTFIPRFNAITKTIEANSLRNNQAEVAEAELAATLQNLSTAADEGSFKSMKWANIVKLFAGQQFNDPAVAKYGFHLEQLRTEFAMYNAALGGQIDANGNIRQVDKADFARAERIIQDGFAQGGITGFSSALQASMSKMKTVLNDSIERQNRRVWDLFGVGQNYKDKGGKMAPGAGGIADGTPVVFPDGSTGTWDAKLGKAVKK